MTAYVILQADILEEAAKLFEEQPHFVIFPGKGVEVVECLPMPGSQVQPDPVSRSARRGLDLLRLLVEAKVGPEFDGFEGASRVFSGDRTVMEPDATIEASRAYEGCGIMPGRGCPS